MFTHTLYAPYTHTHTHTSGFAELCHVCMHACIYPRERERERERERDGVHLSSREGAKNTCLNRRLRESVF
jgi:hypothetical protein